MDAAPPPASSSGVRSPAQSPVLAAWPRSAQWTTAFLIGVLAAVLGYQALGYVMGRPRPAELDREATLAYRLDLNRASRAELLQLPGVGNNLAERIEEHRRARGAFRSVDELTKVRGIGPATLDRLRPWVFVQVQEDDDGIDPVAEPPPRPPVSQSLAKGNDFASKKIAKLTEPIDINHATPEELQRLPGIGPKLSQSIVAERNKGLFKSVEDLRRVRGIGAKTLERLRPLVTVDDQPNRILATN